MKKNQEQPAHQTTNTAKIVAIIATVVVGIVFFVIINQQSSSRQAANKFPSATPLTSLDAQVKEPSQQNVAGQYAASLSTTTGEYKITLNLESSGTASLTEKFSANDVSTQTGSWQVSKNGEVQVSIGQQVNLKFSYTSVPATLQYQVEDNSYWQEAITLVKQESLQSCQWRWQYTQTSQGAQITPKQKDAFKISFNANGGLYIQTDCNTGSSTYTIIDQRIDIHPIATTLRYCPDTQESEFLAQLQMAEDFKLSDNTLQLHLKDKSTMVFSAVLIPETN